jgi:hypothetical protein
MLFPKVELAIHWKFLQFSIHHVCCEKEIVFETVTGIAIVMIFVLVVADSFVQNFLKIGKLIKTKQIISYFNENM